MSVPKKSISTPLEPPPKPTQKPSKILFNIADTEYEVIKKVAKTHFDWKLTDSEHSDWDLTWTDSSISSEKLQKLKPYQKINHFPGMHGICKKHYLAWNLNKMQKNCPLSYNFFPKTWVLPGDYNDLKLSANKQRIFIVKPEASSQGQGILLVNRFEDINLSERLVVQEYLNDPYLIDGLKFDLRIYVLVTGCNPLRAFIHEDGLTRLATETYTEPNEENFGNCWMHLTNYAINKNNAKFVFNRSEVKDDVGHKRSLESTFKYLAGKGHDVDGLKREIEDIVIKTLCCVQPALKHLYHSCQPNDTSNSMCFELLGFDIILDSSLKPWLLEVNHTPSFTTDSPLDYKIKSRLIKDTLTMLNLNPNNRIAFNKAKKIRYFTKQKSGNIEMGKNLELSENIKDEWENNNAGRFKPLISVENKEKFEGFIQIASRLWSEIGRSGKKSLDKSREVVKVVPKYMPIPARKKFSYLNRSIKPSQSVVMTEEPKESDLAETLELKRMVESNKQSFNFLNGKDLNYYTQLNEIFRQRRHSITFLKGTEFHSTVLKMLKPFPNPKDFNPGAFIAPKSFEFIPLCITKPKPHK